MKSKEENTQEDNFNKIKNNLHELQDQVTDIVNNLNLELLNLKVCMNNVNDIVEIIENDKDNLTAYETILDSISAIKDIIVNFDKIKNANNKSILVDPIKIGQIIQNQEGLKQDVFLTEMQKQNYLQTKDNFNFNELQSIIKTQEEKNENLINIQPTNYVIYQKENNQATILENIQIQSIICDQNIIGDQSNTLKDLI